MSNSTYKVKTKYLCKATEEGANTTITRYTYCSSTINQNSTMEARRACGEHGVVAPVKADFELPEYAKHTDNEPGAS